MFKKIDKEKLCTGLVGIIAFIAIIFEVVFSNFDKSSVAGAIKDFSGIIIDIAMLFIAFNIFKPKKKVNEDFEGAFKEEFEKVIDKYNPIVSYFGIESTKAITNAYRYNIANKLDSISTKVPGGNHKFFRIKQGMQEIEFSVSPTVFAERKDAVASRISSRIKDSYNDFIKEYLPSPEGFKLQLNKPLLTRDDAITMSEIIDHILLLYIAEYKKQ